MEVNSSWKLTVILSLLAGVVFLVLAGLPGEGMGETLTVDDDDVGADHTSIQDAIDNATDGDTIRVFSGTYYETIDVNKQVSLVGNGSGESVIDGGGGDEDVVTISKDNVLITGFTITNGRDGVYVRKNYARIIENEISGNDRRGIFVITSSDGEYSHIANNTITKNNWTGLDLNNDHHTIMNNTCSLNNRSGMALYGCKNTSLDGNRCLNNLEDGIALEYMNEPSRVENNTCSGNDGSGIRLEMCDNFLLSSNTCSGNGGSGIFLDTGSNNNVIRENICYENKNGIELSTASDNDVKANTCEYNSDHGIKLSGLNRVMVCNNSLFRNRMGIVVVVTSFATIRENNCSLNQENGIYVLQGSSNDLENNTCGSNGWAGIELDSTDENNLSGNRLNWNGEHGIFMKKSDENELFQNFAMENDEAGVLLENGDDNLFTWNTINLNTCGFDIDDFTTEYSRGNVAHYNRIFDNNVGIQSSQQQGTGIDATLNWWGHPSGPYHSDNSDGKGNSVSLHQLYDPWLPFAMIESDHPDSAPVGETVNFTGSGLSLSPIVGYAWHSSIDGELHNGTTASFSTSTLSNGSHEISFRIRDEEGNWSVDSLTSILIYRMPQASISGGPPNATLFGDLVRLVGGGSAEGSIVRFSWRSSIAGPLYNGTNYWLSRWNLSMGTHTIFLKVLDDFDQWSEEVSILMVIHERPVAFIESINPFPTAQEIDTITFTGNGTDDGTIERYYWKSTLDGPLYNGSAPVFEHSGLSPGDHTIWLRVQDEHGIWSNVVTASLKITAYTPPNQIPTTTVTSPVNHSVISDTVTILGTSSDPDGNETIEWVEVSIIEEVWQLATGTTNWSFQWDTTKQENGEITIRVRGFDGTNFSDVQEITVKVENKNDEGGDSGGEGFIPGFGGILCVIALAVGFLTCRKRRACV
jgi:nitrous oxidase accessory protein